MIQKIQKDETFSLAELNETDAINMITDVNLSDRQAVQLLRYNKQKLGKGILGFDLERVLQARKKYLENLNQRKICSS